MYVVPPPRSGDPSGGGGGGGGGDTTEGSPPRVYQTWKGSNVFFLQGRFIFGPDARSMLLTILLIAAPVIIFCVFVAKKLMDDFPHHYGISIMVCAVAFTVYDLALLLLTSGRDPGIIPRNTHPPELEGYEGFADVGGGQTPQLRLPRMKDVVVNGITVKVKYCDTCMLYRPPRCSHCSICNNCVERFDHHCPWVGQCIGRRNYRFFFMFVFSTTLLCLYVFSFCWVYITRIKNAEDISIWKAMIKTPASMILIIYTFIAVWFVGGLTVFHLYLISTNQTTYENFRYRYDRRDNPYNRGVVNNFGEIFWTSIPPSKNKFRVRVPLEPEVPPRMAGGGFMSPNMGKAMGDIEMGRKPVWIEGGAGNLDGQLSNEDGSDGKGDHSCDASPSLNGTPQVEMAGGGIDGIQNRHSSWGRKGESWEISSDLAPNVEGVGELNQFSGGNMKNRDR